LRGDLAAIARRRRTTETPGIVAVNGAFSSSMTARGIAL
jgi:hypothetical protein